MSRCALGCSAKMVSGRSPNSSRAFGSAPEFNAATARAKLFPAAAASSFCVLDRLVPTFSVSNGSDSSIHLVNAPPKATVPSVGPVSPWRLRGNPNAVAQAARVAGAPTFYAIAAEPSRSTLPPRTHRRL
jgi:hypothetical protein